MEVLIYNAEAAGEQFLMPKSLVDPECRIAAALPTEKKIAQGGVKELHRSSTVFRHVDDCLQIGELLWLALLVALVT